MEQVYSASAVSRPFWYVEFKKEMSISYSDYDAGDGKLKSVYLSFDTKEDDDTFYLTYKSGPDGED